MPDRPGSLRERDGADVVEVSKRLHAAGMTDGLPVVPPTVERVEAMLHARDPKRVIETLPPLFREVTVEDVAICAVLAGCGPEHMPALLAATRAVAAPEFNLLGVTTTTGTTAVGMVLHGPYAEAVGAGSGTNCLGPGNWSNAVLGRALALVLRAAAGAAPGIVDMSTMGQPAKYGFCFAESSVAALPPVPLPTAGGVGAVTVFASSGTVEVVDSHSVDPLGLLETLASAMPTPGTLHAERGRLGSGHPVVVIPPEWAQRLAGAGLSRMDITSFLHRESTIPIERLAAAQRDAVTDDVRACGRIGTVDSPDSILLVVAGGIGTKATYIPTWQGGSLPCTRTITDD
ncbi:MAG: hypothetical protein ABS81_10980 [Pseudonocardia sp. SCN 72-86]|nr:MAG: hypothetical protein ABS81_10980 [Pseudonocardia sp. SCN 72-86]